MFGFQETTSAVLIVLLLVCANRCGRSCGKASDRSWFCNSSFSCGGIVKLFDGQCRLDPRLPKQVSICERARHGALST